MSQRAEAWLRDLQGAVTARRLYPADHPRVVELLVRLESHVRTLTLTRSEYSAFTLDGRIVSDDGIVESLAPLARGVFSTLRAFGFDRITVARGADRGELLAIVQQLADAEPAAAATAPPLRSTPNVRFSRLLRPEAEQPLDAEQLTEGRGPLMDVWSGIAARRTCDLDVLEAMVLGFGQQLRENRGTLIPLAQLTAHDAYTVTHIANVALLAMATGEALGLNGQFVHDLGLAALLHDIGKLKVPADVLNAPGRLNETQLATMKKHPQDGARLLMATPGAPHLAVIVAFEHHLDDNGGGYPAVPPTWKIHLASAITHIVDVYDALRSNRPYRKGLAPEVVAEMMRADAGTVFDKALLQAFFERVAPRLAVAAPSDAPEPAAQPAPGASETGDAPAPSPAPTAPAA
jgi:HD-GYP domain-containing protein (c-di-GMP phosphodiesterase class II)